MTTNSQDDTVNELDDTRENIANILRTGHYGIAETKVVNALNAYISKELKAVIGDDEEETYSGAFFDRMKDELAIDNNKLRAEQRARAKAKGYDV